MTRRWVIGDKHDCPRHASKHVADRGCANYAMEHGDHSYVGVDEAPDLVNHPRHYTSSPSGVECIQVTEHLGFCIGNAIKYLWRADAKGAPLEDLRKARWYVDREIARRERLAGLPRRDADGRTEVEA